MKKSRIFIDCVEKQLPDNEHKVWRNGGFKDELYYFLLIREGLEVAREYKDILNDPNTRWICDTEKSKDWVAYAIDSFSWARTKQGYKYWRHLFEKYSR